LLILRLSRFHLLGHLCAPPLASFPLYSLSPMRNAAVGFSNQKPEYSIPLEKDKKIWYKEYIPVYNFVVYWYMKRYLDKIQIYLEVYSSELKFIVAVGDSFLFRMNVGKESIERHS
jgi:hypothetical protein